MAQLALGTAQFGLDYGINNKRGRIPENEVLQILDFAAKNRITTLDTADSYGESERVLGKYLPSFRNSFDVVSKYSSSDSKSIKEKISTSLSKLHSKKLYGYLLHHFSDYAKNKDLWHDLEKVRSEGLSAKIGFSLYFPEELEKILEDKLKFDLIQVPYSILDQRFEKYLPDLKAKGAEVHVRSVFLQGLLLRQPEELTEQFIEIKDKITALNELSGKTNLSTAAVCLCFAAVNKNIDKIIIGVDGLENLKENVRSFGSKEKVRKILDELKRLKEYNENIILPSNWSNRL